LVKSGLIAAAAVVCSTHGVVAAVSEAPVATGCPTILDQVPAKGAYLLVGGPKVMGGTGGPSRVIAMF
jgi:hypothetical protein